MWYRTPVVLKEYNKRNDAKALIQCVGFLMVCILTGYLTWKWWAFVILHGTVCSFASSGLHELSHRNMFNRRWLNSTFTVIYEFLSWTSASKYWKTHSGHHKMTLLDDDPEAWIVLRSIWWLAIVFEFIFNLPRLLMSLINAPLWVLSGHSAIVYFAGAKALIVVTLACFSFGWLQFLCSYPQHAGLPVGIKDFRQCCRSLHLPGWLSFLYWYMEHHIEHHMYYSVPCYNLKRLSRDLKFDMPKAEGLIEFWRNFQKRVNTSNYQ